MTKQIAVITDSTGTKAWTLNPIEKPEYLDVDGFPSDQYQSYSEYENEDDQWQQAESERKCYEIEPHRIVSGHNGICKEWATIIYEPNILYLAEIVDENTVRILKEV